MAKKDKPRVKLTGTLVALGHDEDYGCNVLRLTIAGAREPVVTVPVTQAVVKKMAPFLYEKVTLTMEVL